MSFKIEHRIGISRPAAEVWAVLYDTPAWKDWNPMYPDLQGKLLISAPLNVTEVVGGRTETYAVTVAEWVPNAQLIWTRKTHAGLLSHVRYLEIEPLTDTGCIFANGELFQGFAAPYLVTQRRRRALKGAFRGLCEALKARVEAGHGADTDAWKR